MSRTWEGFKNEIRGKLKASFSLDGFILIIQGPRDANIISCLSNSFDGQSANSGSANSGT